jgi:hypothetical protein
MTNAIPTTVQEVLDLFEGELAHMKFGDLEEAVLAKASQEVVLAAEAAEKAEATLTAARAVLAEQQESLLKKAQRALAYLRVYAEGDAALSARLEQITLPRPLRRSSKVEGAESDKSPPPAAERRRGRPRKGAYSPADGGALLDLTAPHEEALS